MNKLYLNKIRFVSATVFPSLYKDEGYYTNDSDIQCYITKHKVEVTEKDISMLRRNVGYIPKSMYITLKFDMIDFKEEIFGKEILDKEVFDLTFDIETYYANSGGFICGMNPYVLLSEEEEFYFHLKYSHLIKEDE